MKNINKTILITLALLIFNGCSGLLNNSNQGYFTSQVSLKDSKLTSTITHDMINFIQNYYPISKTTFYFQLDSSAYNQGVAIEDSLRNVGYGISYIKKRGQIPFAYKIDFIDKNIMRTTYNIGKSTLSRLYNIENGNIIPQSSFTTRGFKKRIYYRPYSQKNNYQSKYSNQNNAEVSRKALVSIPVLNIRNKPSKQGKIVGKLYKNSLVYVTSTIINRKGKEWCRVAQEGSLGNLDEYISSQYINYIN